MSNRRLAFCWLVAVVLAGSAAWVRTSGPQVIAVEPASDGAVGEEVPAPTWGDDIAGMPLPLPQNVRITRHFQGGDGTQPVLADSATTEKLIYSNTTGTFYYAPRAHLRISDDIITDAIDPCNVTRYVIRVTGGVANGTGEFETKVSLWTLCPNTNGGGGLLIPDTERIFTGLPDDVSEIHELIVDFPGGLALPPTFWMRVEFDTNSAGWVVGSAADKGFTGNNYDHPFTGCNTWFGGDPYAGFYAQVYADKACETHHLVYAAFAANAQSFPVGQNKLAADDVEIVEGSCELSAYEVGMKGTSGPFAMQLGLRPRNGITPFAGTERTYSSIRGNGILELARFTFPPGIFIDQNNLWLTWKANKSATGVALVGRNQAGFSRPEWYEWEAMRPNEWFTHPNANSRSGIFYINIYCRGEAPLGACCPTQRPNQPIACNDAVPVTSCLGARWVINRTCASDPFNPDCGTHACCQPNNSCRDRTYAGCTSLMDPQTIDCLSPTVHCTTDADCPPNRTCGPLPCVSPPCQNGCPVGSTCQGGTCSGGSYCSWRTAVWQPGNFCEFNQQRCPLFQCFYGTGDCFAAEDEIICMDDGDCPGEQRCLGPPERICTRRAGCGNIICCDLVCREGDPFCCTSASGAGWDDSCVGVADQICDIPPGSDDCAHLSPSRGAVPITISAQGIGFAIVNNLRATQAASDPVPCCNNQGIDVKASGTVWYKFVMPTTAIGGVVRTSARVHTCNTAGSETPLDSILQVFSVGDNSTEVTACNSLGILACNDDTPGCGNGDLMSDMCLQGLTPGATYYIMLGSSFPSSQGSYRLDIRIPCTTSGPLNDKCSSATPISGMTFVDDFDLNGATLDCPAERCSEEMKNDIWYQYIAGCTGATTVETCDANVSPLTDPPTALAVYEVVDPLNICPGLTANIVGCNEDALVGPGPHTHRAQNCEFAGLCTGQPAGRKCLSARDCNTCSGLPANRACTTAEDCRTCSGQPANTPCTLDGPPCPAGQSCSNVVQTCGTQTCNKSCDTSLNCQKVCTSGTKLCDSTRDCNHCAVGDTPCLTGNDCKRCNLTGPLCNTVADCAMGESCIFTGTCVVSGDTCDPDKCISSCGQAASVTVPTFQGTTYLIRLGGDRGLEPNGEVSVRCVADDCDGDNVPDLYEIAHGTQHDCNENQEPDECEITPANRAMKDCNNNGKLDVCEIDRDCVCAPGAMNCQIGPFFCLTNCNPDVNDNCRPDGPGCDPCTNATQCQEQPVDNLCTTDTCVNSMCQRANNTNACNDNNGCTLNDACANGVCTGTPRVCNDNNPCTDDSCVNGNCQFTNDNTNTCSDNLTCTTGDHCNNGACVGTSNCPVGQACNPPAPGTCGCTTNAQCQEQPVDNPCTTDTCVNSVCQRSNNTIACNDNNGCTVNDVCANGTCSGAPCPPPQVCQNGMCSGGNGCTAIASSDPPDCEIDARQPHAVANVAPKQGFDRLILTMSPAGCQANLLTMSNFTLQVAPGPQGSLLIQSVMGAGSIATVMFNQVIPTKNWTCVRGANGVTGKACIGFLPVDVNKSRASNAQDITALINALNNVTPRPLLATDANRSGAANAQDIPALINLLNGAGQFGVSEPGGWLNKTIPVVCPP